MRVRERLTSLADSDRGASAVLVAASLVMLMGFAALAVDSGVGFNDRRQQASAADVGALAALQFAKTTLTATHPDCTGLTGKFKSACRGAEEAVAVIDGTLPGRYDDAEWGACVDANPPAEYTTAGGGIVSAISPCISFTNNLKRSRVVLPGSDVETAFGKAIGFSTIRVSAFAEAGLELKIVGGVWPFAIGPAASGTNQACFAAGDTHTLDAAPCGAGTQGNYGKLDVFNYGNEDYPTPTICTGSNTQRMMTNIVAGSDHPMVTNPPPGTATLQPVVNETTNCNNLANPVNQFEVATGNSPVGITDAFFKGVTTPPNLEGRLLCKGGLSSNQSREDYPLGSFTSTQCTPNPLLNTHPEAIDHSPLWTYINPGANAQALGGGCDPGAWTKKGRDKMEQCLANWKAWPFAHTIPLFTSNVVTSPRFGAVPVLDQNPGNGTSIKYTIKDFKPVYLETLYLGCGANKCDIVHSPGETSTGACPAILTPSDWSCGWSGNGVKILDAVSAFVLTLDMLPADIAENFPFQPGTIVYNLYR